MIDLKSIQKVINNEYASIAEDGTYCDTASFIDTGSFTLNALFSGSIYGGIPSNKIVALAGEEATGKTFFLLSIVKNFLDSDNDAIVILFESEGAVSRELLGSRGIDTSRVLIVPVETIEGFSTQALKIVEEFLKQKNKPKVLMALDSLGMLSTTKEMKETESGSGKKDMTRAQLIRGTFRTLTMKLGKANIPLIMTNHVYQTVGQFISKKEVSGGGGLKYAASSIIFLAKGKFKDGSGNQIGTKIFCKAAKSRLTREGTQIEVLLHFVSGLDRYYGLLDLALDAKIFKKVSTKIVLPNGESVFSKHIGENPEDYFKKEILDQIDEYVKNTFQFGMALSTEDIVEEILSE